MLVEIANIIAGLILAMGILPNIPAIGKDLARVAKWLGGFQTIIGVISLIIGLLYFGLQGIVAILAGLILAMGLLPNIPAIGKDLAKAVKVLGSFQTIIGIIAIVLGIWGLLF
jgi:membrane protein HdeD